jgi:hypothetical protein
MKKGDLVRHKATGEIGIVLAMNVTADHGLFAFLGSGLATIETEANLEVVPFSPVTSIPANFSDLTEAYEREGHAKEKR